jgi:hypothetical protein
MTAVTRTEWLERSAAVLLGCGAVLGPLFLGGGWVWSRFGLEAMAVLAVTLWLVATLRPLSGLLPPLVVAGLLSLQLVPFPTTILAAVAPLPAQLWADVSQHSGAGTGTISIDPGLTVNALCRLFLGACAITTTADLGRKIVCRRILIGALTASAVLILVTGGLFPRVPQERLVFKTISLAGPIEGYVTPVDEPFQTTGVGSRQTVRVGRARYDADAWGCGDGFGSFIYSNHFCNAVCVTLPVAAAVWLARTRAVVPDIVRFGVVGSVVLYALWLVAAVGSCRAGTAALVIAGLTFAAFSAAGPRGRWLAWSVLTGAIVAVLAFATILYVPGGRVALASVLPDSQSLVFAKTLLDSRPDASTTLGMLAASPVAGIGLGCYGEAEPSFSTLKARMYFAHNDYAQWLAETGAIGGLILIGCIALLCHSGWRHLAVRSFTSNNIVTAGLWAALAGLAVHSLFDWNLHMPANCFAAQVVAGLCLTTSVAAADCSFRPRWLVSQGMATVVVIACGAALCILYRDARTVVLSRELAAATAMTRTKIQSSATVDSEKALRRAIQVADEAKARHISNSRLAVLAGQARLHLAALTIDPDESKVLIDSAHHLFDWARQSSPACRGLPHE